MVRRPGQYMVLAVVGILIMAAVVPAAPAEDKLTGDKALVVELADKNAAMVKEIGSTIWGMPEIGLNEYRSSHYLANKLEEMGFDVERGVAQFPTAFVGTFTFGEGGPVIGLLAEYDALPGVSYDNPGENGHGCGHNLYCAGAFGTASILKEFMETQKVPGTIKVFGTPAEENFDGKAWMGRQGVLKGVDMFFGFHGATKNTVPFGSNNAMDYKIYTFHGKSSHAGSAPDKGVSALDAVEIMNVAVNYLREHVPMEVRMHYIISIGGEAPNVVPAIAQSKWFIRAPQRETVDDVVIKVDNAARGSALAAGCTVDIDLVSALHNKIPIRSAVDLAWKNYQLVGAPDFTAEDQESIKFLGLKENIRTELEAPPENPSQSYGSSDEGDVSWNAPLVSVQAANYAADTAGHSIELDKQANMDIAYKAHMQLIKVTACTAVDLLTKPEELKKIKDDFAETMKGKEYKPGDKVMLDLKYFPEPPGVRAELPNKLSFKTTETIFDEAKDTIVNVYNGDALIGIVTLSDPKEEYSITTKTGFKAEDILTVKYQLKGQPEIVYGYVKKY